MKLLQSSPLLLLIFLFAACSSSENITHTTAHSNSWEWIATPSWYDYSQHDTLSVVTWNIEHFIDDYNSPYIDHPRENEPGESLSKRRALLAEAIMELDADIVVFQEVESAAYIQSLANEHFDEMGYRYFTGRESNDWYMNVVVMSRIPLGMLYSYANADTYILGEQDEDGNTEHQNFTNNRMVSVDVHVNPSYSFMLTNVHLKAGRGDRNEGWRTGQINLLREHYSRIYSSDPSAKILVAGDFNALPGDPEFLQFLGEGTPLLFVDPFADVDSFTHTSDNPTRQLDHIIPNKNMSQDLVAGSAVIPTPFDSETMRVISDHLPVMMKFITTGE